MPQADQTPGYSARLSKFLPPSLGSLFGQPMERVAAALPAAECMPIPGARNAPELCTLLEPWRADLMPKHAVAEVKLDGIRCLYAGGQLFTREGSTFEAASHCLPILRDAERYFGQPMFFDGEYVEEGGLEATISAFRSRKGAGVLWLFDAVPFDQWKSGRPSLQSLVERKANLRRRLLDATHGSDDVSVGYIEHVPVAAPADVDDHALGLWRQGYEGLVVKAAGSLYVRKRTCDWMKVKLRTVSTMVVVDVAGCFRNGRNEAKALIVRLPGEDTSQTDVGKRLHRPIRVPVAAGGLAETLWQRRGDLIGRSVDVEHAGFTGAGNPREAILKTVRLP